MNDKIALLEAEAEAEKVVARHGFQSFPVCPFTIAQEAGIVVAPKDSREPGVSGYLMRVGDVFGIQYARHIANDGYIRFTVAHELGHYFLPGHVAHLFKNGESLHRSRSGFVSDDPHERQADQFASALLMPNKLFGKAVDNAGIGFPGIQGLATLCKTSLTATAIRYTQFTAEAVAVIVSSGRQIDYCFMSDRIRDLPGITWIKKGDMLPTGTTTAEFNANPSSVEEAKQEEGTSSLDDWFDGAPAVEVNEDVIGLGSYGKTLTVLFTEEAIEDEDEHDD